MSTPSRATLLLDGLSTWLAAGPGASDAAWELHERLSGLRQTQVAALLRSVRWSTWRLGQVDSTAAFAPVLDRALSRTDPAHRAATLLACLAHRSGYAREVAVRQLMRLEGDLSTRGLAFAADDPVEQVRAPAQRALLERPTGQLGRQAGRIRRPAPDDARAGWRLAARSRLSRPDGVAALLGIALHGDEHNADDAAQLLAELGVELPPGSLASSTSWRVRRRVGVQAVDGGQLGTAAALLQDGRVAVRYAVAWRAAHLHSPEREELLLHAVGDSSVRVLRIVGAYCGDSAEFRSARDRLLASDRPRDQVRGLRLLAVSGPVEAPGVAESRLDSQAAVVRKQAYLTLAATGALEAGHVARLARDPSPVVVVAGARQAVQVPALRPLLAPVFDSPGFAGQPGASGVVARLPVWDAVPWINRALSEGWPGVESALQSVVRRLQELDTKGWIHPSARQLEATRGGLAEARAATVPAGAAELHRSYLSLLGRAG